MNISINELSNNSIKDKTCNGQCSRCGDCCGLFIPLNDDEIKIIKDYVSKHNIQPVNRFVNNQIEARCCFYNEKEHKCNIYEVRPSVCKDFSCNHKDWLKRRDQYESRSKYNSTLSSKLNIATFDDLIYGDVRYILQYLFSLCYVPNQGIDSDELVKLLRAVNRLDLLNYITGEDEKGNKFDGNDLLKLEMEGK